MIEPKDVDAVIAECEHYFEHHLDYDYDWDTMELIYGLAKEIKDIKNDDT